MPGLYHNSAGHKLFKNSNHVYIYNVSKKLVKQFGTDYSVGFRYPESDNGYAHFVVNGDELFDSKNPNFYHVIVPKDKTMRLNYMKDGREIGVVTPPADIKAEFEKSRVSGKNMRRREANAECDAVREIPCVDHGCAGQEQAVCDDDWNF